MKTKPKKRIKRKKGKSGKGSVYFTAETESVVCQFVAETDTKKREQLASELSLAINKLVENIMFVHKFNILGDVDSLKSDCVSFLFEVLPKFNPEKGYKAFSYLSVVAKNWFIQKTKSKQRRMASSSVHFNKSVLNYLEKKNDENVVFSYEDQLYKAEFMEMLKEYMYRWRNRFEKPQEKKVLEAVILLVENPNLLSIYNKKGIFIYLKEMTGLNTKQITTNLGKMKKKYNIIKDRYNNGDL